MGEIDDKALTYLAGQAFRATTGVKQPDFLDELGLEMKFVKAYLDPVDNLPVTVLEIKTSKVARNSEGALHTGALCVMMDHLSTYSVFADKHWWDIPNGDIEQASLKPQIMKRISHELGLSRNIKLHVQQPVVAGSTVYFVTKVLENGPPSSYFFSQIFNTDGELLATGHHDKVKLTKDVKPKL